MKHLNWMLGLSLLGLAATAAAAEDREPGARLKALDTDGDGSISYLEFEAADGGRLARLDSDGNGVVSLDEFLNGRPDRLPRGTGPAGREIDEERLAHIRERLQERATTRFHEMDSNGDEALSQSEMAEDSFLRLDRDGNGLLSGRELRPPRGARPGFPGLSEHRGARGTERGERRSDGRAQADTGQSDQE